MSNAISPAALAARRLERVAVFFDYENVHRTAHYLFTSQGTPIYRSAFNPIALAERVVAKRLRPSTLTDIRVYRGRPVPEHQPTPASAFDIQRNVWQRDARVTMRTRDLQYRFDDKNPAVFQAREKGIDVSLAIDLVGAAINVSYDAMIVFSCDTDLLPAIELVRDIQKVHLEIACWNGANPLFLREGLKQVPPRYFPYCHYLNEVDFSASKESAANHL